MSQGFVWFHNGGGEKVEAQRFYEGLLGWRPVEGPGGMTMLAREGAPFASLGAPQGGAAGWVPYAQVDELDVATQARGHARRRGAAAEDARTRGGVRGDA